MAMGEHRSGKNRIISIFDPLKDRVVISLIAVGVMVILLLTSIGIFFIDSPAGVDHGGGGSDNEKMGLEITYLPAELRSGMQQEIRGMITDDKGIPVPDALVTINFTNDPDDIYRTTSGPDGQFTLPFWSPETESDSTYDFDITGSKNGYDTKSIPLELEIVTPDDWTFMIYMSDCDLEEFALNDINEMESIPHGDHLNIIAQLDRWESLSPKDDRSDGNWTSARRYLIEPDSDTRSIGSRLLEELGEINTADPMELVDFATWAMEGYPADRYALVLWNHGSGIDGICWEQSMEEDDVITIKELGEALDSITGNIGRPLDIIGFDACLMSTIEVAYEIAPYSRYMLGSEITEPTFGWDYGVLDELIKDPFLTEMELAEEIIGGYISQTDLTQSKRSLSMGVLDLIMADGTVSRLDNLSNAINSAGSAEIYNMRIARKYSQPISNGYSSDAVDLKDYVEKIMDLSASQQVKESAQLLLDSLTGMIAGFDRVQGISDIDTNGLNGISIYSPDFKDVMDQNEDYDDLKFVEDTSWKQTLLSYYENMGTYMEERVVSFQDDLLSCKVKDEDGDLLPDTMVYQFRVVSEIDEVDVFLGINVYDLRGDYINSTWLELNLSSSEDMDLMVKFQPRGEDREPGMYRIVAYLCLGPEFDPLSLQDYTRSGYRWLEIYG
ncbi:MAG: hypothetical protein JXA22_09630 [Candidatus Thermoplasmatota archaeon]|nr:hypothetical protein [Candidatus Thermoplasmatota archaeon]